MSNISASGEVQANSGSFNTINSPDQSFIKYHILGISANGTEGAQVGDTLVVGPTLNVKGEILANSFTGSFVGDGSKLTNLPSSGGGGGWDGTTDITLSSGKTLDISSGTLDVSSGTLTLANNQISGDKVEGGTIASITISQLGGALDCNNENMTNVDIDSGTIDGTTIATSDVTVGASKTLNVSAGTLTTSTAQKQAIVQAGPGSGTIDVSSGTLTTSTAQKKTIVDDAGHTEVLSDVQFILIQNYASLSTLAGTTGAHSQWYGPDENIYFWQTNYGTDGEVVALPPQYCHRGHIVPFSCILLGFHAVLVNETGTTPGVATFALYSASGGAATFDDTSGGAADLALTQRSSANFTQPGQAGNPVKASVTNGTTALSAQDMIYPRFKMNVDETKDVFMSYTILIKRN